MTEEIREKLKQLYDAETEIPRNVIQVFIDQFDEPMVDNTLVTFDEFLEVLNSETLGSMGISRLDGPNGEYHIDRVDYETNGRGKSFTEYIPDLRIIDYVSPFLKNLLWEANAGKHADNSSDYFHITVRFPKVTVTNEYDKSIDITELFARVLVTKDGKTAGKFKMTRTEYTTSQWLSDYAHSHLSGICREHPEAFRKPCTGQGPINNTIDSLSHRCDLNLWGLYTFELSKYVTVESISGVPYRRLESVGKDEIVNTNTPWNYVPLIPIYPSITPSILLKFVREFVSTADIKIAYRNNQFTLGEDFTDFWIKVSAAFIKWFNSRDSLRNITVRQLYDEGLIRKYIIADGLIYNETQSGRMEEITHLEGREMFMFKGKMLRLHFLGNTRGNVSYLVDTRLCYYILGKILEIISYNYGRTETSSEGVTDSSQKCYYA